MAPTIYEAFRERLTRDLMTPILGPLASEAFAAVQGGGVAHMVRIQGAARRDDPRGRSQPACRRAPSGPPCCRARSRARSPTSARRWATTWTRWRWERLHITRPAHPLVAGFPHLAKSLNPPAVAIGGDGETVNAAGFVPGAGYHVALTSVARYAFDLADWESERLGRAPRRIRPCRQPALGRPARRVGGLPATADAL